MKTIHTIDGGNDRVLNGEALRLFGEHPLLRRLGADAQETVYRASRLVPYRPNRTLVKEGASADTVHCLLSGAVRVFHRAADGSEALVGILAAPSCFGSMEVLTGRDSMEFVTTLDYCQVLHIPSDLFRNLLRSQPDFATAVLHDQAQRLCARTTGTKTLALMDTDARLARLFLEYGTHFGTEEADGVRITLSLSQEGMARDLSICRKSLTRSLAKLKSDGLITKRDARYVILDGQGLQTLAGIRQDEAQRDEEARIRFREPVRATRPAAPSFKASASNF